jgi:hypothetical protein
MRPSNIYLVTARQMEHRDAEDVQDDWEHWGIDAINAIDLDELDTLEDVDDFAGADDDVFASSDEHNVDGGSSDSDSASTAAEEEQQVIYNTEQVGLMTSTSESVYRIRVDGSVQILQKPAEQELWRFYLAALQCQTFTVVRQHRVEVAGVRTDFRLLLLGDDEDILRGSARNESVTAALAATEYGDFFGDALVVCLHAVDEDGDDENLADVGLIYEAIGRGLPTPWTAEETAAVRAAPLKRRVLELLGLFDLE